jgi:aminoglycoside phosphotransferase (APT) family kinase protein
MPVPRRDLEKTRGWLAGWLCRQLPDARDLAISTLTGPAATGFSNDTLLFELSYAKGGRRIQRALVCRAEPTGFRVFPRYDVAQQFRIMKALSGTGVPVPEMLWIEADVTVLGSPFFVMERVEGSIPSDNPPYHADGWVTGLDPDERCALWNSAVDALAAIHQQDPAALGLDFLSAPPAGGADACAWQLEHWSSYCDWVTAGQRQPTLDAARAWLRARTPHRDDPLRLCWGDARIGNMIFREGRCQAVLDWEMATLGPPEMDLGWFLYMDRHHSEGVGAPRLPGFPERQETVTRWEGHLGRPARDLEYWEAFAAFRFAAIMTRVGQQLVHFGILPADSTFTVDNTASRMLARILQLPPPGQT